MKLKQGSAPHIRYQDSTLTMMTDMILLLSVLVGMAGFFYGSRALMLCLTAVVSAVLSDMLCIFIRGRRPNPRDLSPVVTGLIIALAMPATVNYSVVIAAVLFAVVVVKHPFGGTGHNPFNPAAAGISFAIICWPQQMFNYPMPFEKLSILGQYSDKLNSFVYTTGMGSGLHEVIIKLYQNPVSVLRVNAVPSNDQVEMLFGNFPGPMGATNLLVILTCLCYLLLRKTIRWQLPLAYFATCSALAFLFPRAFVSSSLSVYFEMMSGLLLFGGVFLLADPVTTPKRDSSLVVYGVLAGLITMLFRYFGGFDESVTFAILFANAFVSPIDRYSEGLHRLIRRKHLELKSSKNTKRT